VSDFNNLSWRDGRRIIEVGFLADQLKEGCLHFGESLCLFDTIDETKLGLGIIL
jgi:hypothetical protein